MCPRSKGLRKSNSKEYNYSKPSKQLRQEILVTGMGGEGVVLTAELLSLGATLDGKFASQRSTYGASQHGEAIFSEVIVSKNPIQYTFVESPTHFIALSQQGFDTYYHKILNAEDTKLFLEWSHKFNLMKLDKKFGITKLGARQIAMEHGMYKVYNIIILSAFVHQSQVISDQALKDALLSRLPQKLHKENMKALTLGLELVDK